MGVLETQLSAFAEWKTKNDTRQDAIIKRLDAMEKSQEGYITKGLNALTAVSSKGRGQNTFTGQNGRQHELSDILDPFNKRALGVEFGHSLQEIALLTSPKLRQDPHLGEQLIARGNSDDVVRKSLTGRGINVVTKALAEGVGSTGGYTLPIQFNMELMRLAAEESFLRQRVRNVPMTTREVLIPTLDQTGTTPAAGQSEFFGGIYWQWEPEGSNYQTNAQTQPGFRQVQLTARDLVGIVIASNQLLADNAVGLDTVLTTIFKEAAAWAYDYWILRGNGASQPLGMINSPCAYTQSFTTTGKFLFPDVLAMRSHMVESSSEGCVWIMHQSVMPSLYGMTNNATNSGLLVWLDPYGGDGKNMGPAARKPGALLMGDPVYFTEKLPALANGSLGSVIYTDPSKYLLGDRMAIQIEASQWPLFQFYQTMWRVIMRFDGTPLLTKPITLSDGSFQVSPVILFQA